MRRFFRALLLALAVPLALGQAEPRLVPEVSNNLIEIRYSFSGEHCCSTGCRLPGRAARPRPEPTSPVVIKGPLSDRGAREGEGSPASG
jgi:hypothetical protein